MTFAVGTKLGRYEIRSLIGVGGMGEVYLAEDTKLRRKVALKILPANIAANNDRIRRFVQEATSAAALNHPNIAHIYEIDEAEGTNFITMEYIDGQTLGELMRGRTELVKLLRYLQHAAEGLAKAHAANIVHRDLKPDNIMITREGHAKILDFGLAKLTVAATASENQGGSNVATAIIPQHSTPGTIIGTAGYMSPEQAQGKTREIDHRSDIFSFGCILFEVVTGRRPFEGTDAIDTLNKIIREPVPPVSSFNRDAPLELQKVIRRCLAKDPDDRYQSIKDVAMELKDLRRELTGELETTVPPLSSPDTGSQDRGPTTHPGMAKSSRPFVRSTQASSAEYIVSEIRKHKAAVAVMSFLLLSAVGVGIWLFPLRSPTAAKIESVAVMPFLNASGNAEIEYLSDGITESLINSLSQIPKLSVKARSSVFSYKGKEVSPQQVAKDLSVQAILNGRVLQRGDQVQLSVELVDARTGNQLWGEQYNRRMTDLLSLQSEIARDVSSKLKARLTGTEEQKIAKNYTQNTEAYQLYLQGRYHWNKRTTAEVRKSIEYFQQAIDKDPTYGLAYAALAEGYILIPSYNAGSPQEAFPKARAAALKAIEIDETLAEAHNALAAVKSNYEWKFAEAEAEWQRTIALNPNYATAHQWYGEYLADMGRYNEALAELKRAQELDPLSLIINGILGVFYRLNEQDDQAIEQLRKTLEMDPNFGRTHLFLAQQYESKGMFEEAADEYGKTLVLMGASSREDSARLSAAVKNAYKTSGPKGYWRTMAELLTTFSARVPEKRVPRTVLAGFWAHAGETDKALALLEKAYEEHDDDTLMLKAPTFDPIKSDPRYKDLLRRVGLPE
jgi:eukaryotic-like serine/threonine-protein kinase